MAAVGEGLAGCPPGTHLIPGPRVQRQVGVGCWRDAGGVLEGWGWNGGWGFGMGVCIGAQGEAAHRNVLAIRYRRRVCLGLGLHGVSGGNGTGLGGVGGGRVPAGWRVLASTHTQTHKHTNTQTHPLCRPAAPMHRWCSAVNPQPPPPHPPPPPHHHRRRPMPTPGPAPALRALAATPLRATPLRALLLLLLLLLTRMARVCRWCMRAAGGRQTRWMPTSQTAASPSGSASARWAGPGCVCVCGGGGGYIHD